MVEAKIKARCRFGCRAGCRSGCRAKIPKALILRHFSLSDNHDNQYYKEKGNSKKIVSPDKEKRFSDVRCRNFVVRPFLVGLFSFARVIKKCTSLADFIKLDKREKSIYAVSKETLKLVRNWTSHQGINAISSFDVAYVYMMMLYVFFCLF